MERITVYLVGLAAVLCGYALLVRIRRSPADHPQVGPRTLIFTLAGAAVVGLAIIILPVLLPSVQHPAEGDDKQTDLRPAEMPSDARREPLAVGEIAPALTAQGWINGAPQTSDARLTVVDIWAFW